MTQPVPCAHLRAITGVKHPTRQVCETCVETGATWVHLRTCQQCGVTLCCDDSANRHASRHAKTTGHPVIAYTIAAALQSEIFNAVIVSTDSPRYAEIARHYGGEAPFLRPAELAGELAKPAVYY